MNKIKRNTKVIGVSVLPKHLEYIEHLKTEKVFMSNSDVIRRAIEYFHDGVLPNYIYNKSAADLIKRSKLLKQKAELSITPEMFAESIQAPIVDSPAGVKYVMVGAWGNSRRAILLDNVKEAFADNPDLMGVHKSYIADHGPIPEEFVDDVFPRS